MKYSEFKAEVENMGFSVVDSGVPIYVEKEGGETLLSVGKERRFWLDPGWGGFEALDEVQKLELYALGYKLAKTPLAEREEEKKYYLLYDVPPLLRAVHAKPRYLYRRIYDGYIDTSFSQTNDSTFKTIFTESEIAKMDITGFQEVEVEG